MYSFLIVIHVFVCLVLIAVVLLQAGRGGGMLDMMGGGQTSSLFGTQTNTFMTRATEVCAVIFIVTSLSLAVLSSQRGKSLIESRRLPKTSAVLPKEVQDAITKGVQAANTATPKAEGAAANATAPAAQPTAAP